MKIALGMSGGVDSSLCAHLLSQQGHQVTGVYLECWRAPGCRTDADRADALKVALKYKLPFQVLDFKQAYKQKVVDYFLSAYARGQTPNPDTICNQEIKFGLFYDWAMAAGYDAIATGHYAGVNQINGHHWLTIPTDKHKDQTYFLYLVNENQLAHTVFPLADLTKTQVRQLAEKNHLHVADKKDSTGICFIGEINVHNFLRERLGENPGNVVDLKGNIIGRHQGLWFYTIGQRGGFKINQTSLVRLANGTTITKHNIPPFYVLAKKADANQLVVGFGQETLQKTFKVAKLHWINAKSGQELFKKANDQKKLFVRIRHTGELLSCEVSTGVLSDVSTENLANEASDEIEVKLTTPARGLADGQAAVFYAPIGSHLACVGGGEIVNLAL